MSEHFYGMTLNNGNITDLIKNKQTDKQTPILKAYPNRLG